MSEKVMDMPNLQRFKLCLATESAQDLYPITKAVADAKAMLDSDYVGSALETAVTGAGYDTVTAAGTAYGNVASMLADLPAPLDANNVDGLPKAYDARQFPLGNIAGYVEFFRELRLPVFNSPAEPGDDDAESIKKLIVNMQIVFDAQATLTARGISA